MIVSLRSLVAASAALLLGVTASVRAQAIWTNGTGDFLFSTPGNWTAGTVPVDGANLQFDTPGLIGFDNGGNFTANSLTFNVGADTQLLPVGAETLSVDTGGLLVQGAVVDFQLPLLALSTQLWTITGQVTFSNALDVVGGVLTIDLAGGGAVNFAMSGGVNPLWNGNIVIVNAGAGAVQVVASGVDADNLARIRINGSSALLSGGYLVAAPNGFTPVPEAGAFAWGALALLGAAAALRRFRRVA